MEDDVFNLIVISVTNYNILRYWLCIDGENLSRDSKQALFLAQNKQNSLLFNFLVRKKTAFSMKCQHHILPNDDDNQHKICSYLDI